jgi:hypothetical protein
VRFVHVALVLLTWTRLASAQDKEQCVQAYEEAQTLRVERKFIEAHSRLITCTNAVCPSVISKDCWRWLGEVEAATPALTIAAVMEGGGDVLEATITLDGIALTTDQSGQAIPVNPGPHTLRAEAPGYAPTEQTVVAREGERSRVIKLVLKSLTPAVAASGAASGSEAVNTTLEGETQGRRVTWPVYTLGGIALASVGVGAYFGYTGTQDAKDMGKSMSEGGCKPQCSDSQIDDARTKLIVANVLFGVGGAAAVGALVTYLVSKPKAADDTAAGDSSMAFGFDLDVRRSGGVALLRGSY